MKPIPLEDFHSLVFLTGAGISVASGLRPYRGPGGVWTNNPEAERQATAQGLQDDPAALWRLFGPLRGQARRAQPNEAHRCLARLEDRCRAERRDLTVITQNVDGLHQRAGSRQVVELHGSIHYTRCSRPGCDLAPFEDEQEYPQGVPPCSRCGAPVRPDIVLFGEHIPVDPEYLAKRALRDCDLFVAVGTSGLVAPASGFVRSARYAGARTLLVNLEPLGQAAFDEELIGPADELLPALLAV